MKALYVCLFSALLAASGMALKAQSPAYDFKAVVQPGSTIGGHTFRQDTVIEQDLSLNDQGIVLFIAHWLIPDQTEVTAVFTNQRLVASTGDLVEGKTIMVIAGAWPQINALGQVAYPALYSNDPAKKDVHMGVFVDHHLALTFDSVDGPHDFALSNNGVVTASAPEAPAAQCPLPPFPMPPGWEFGERITPGPIVSHANEPAKGVRYYDSFFLGRIYHPYRIVQYAADCRPLVITFGGDKGKSEIWTSAGLLTYLKPDSGYVFNGFEGYVPSGSFVRADTTLRVNRRGQVALPVNLQKGTVILLGTPVGGSR